MLRTLKGKISFVYIGLVLIAALIGSISLINLAAINRSINGMMTNNDSSIQASQKMISVLARQNTAVLSYLHNGSGTDMDTFYGEDLNFMESYHTEVQHISEKGEKEAAGRILANYTEYRKKISELQTKRGTSDETTAFNDYHSEVLPIFTELNDDLNSIITVNQASMLNSKAKTAQDAQTSFLVILVVSLSAVTAGFFFSRFCVGRFLSPLQKLTATIGGLKNGEFNVKLRIPANDEIGELAAEFNKMAERLKQYEESTKGQLMNERNQSIAIMKSISDPLLILDDRFKAVLINDACESFFGIHESEVLNHHFLEFIKSGELFDAITESVERPGECDRRRQKVIKLQKGDGLLYFTLSVTILKNGPAQKYIVLLHNVTSIKELEQAKTDFFATVSHEFKTPLTAVMMGASLLDNDGLGTLNQRQADTVATIQENAQRLSDFVSELLELSRIEAGKSIYEPEPCTVQAISSDSCRRFEEIADRSGITLTNLIGDDLPVVFVDYEKVTWVINNLISNALKYTPFGGTVTLDAHAGEAEMAVTVADTGEGIPPEFLDRIFEKFVQVKTHDIEARGTGLGLSVAREIISAHKGRIWAESEPGHGSRFTFTLPLYREERE